MHAHEDTADSKPFPLAFIRELAVHHVLSSGTEFPPSGRRQGTRDRYLYIPHRRYSSNLLSLELVPAFKACSRTPRFDNRDT